MHRLGCWKERLLYSMPALVCAISLMSFLCLPHCCRFLWTLFLLTRKAKRIQNHCTDWCKMSAWIGVTVYVCICLSECVSWMHFCWFFGAYTADWGQEFGWSGTHGDSIMHMTATRNRNSQTNCLQQPESVLACTQKWPLNIHTWPTFKLHL